MSEITVSIGFDKVDSATAGSYAHELREAILEQAPDISVDRKRDDSATQDLGTTLGVILSTGAVLAVAKGIQTWLDHRTRSSIIVEREGTRVRVDHLTCKNATELANKVFAHFEQDAWDAAKREAMALIRERARTRGMIPYSELVDGIIAIRFEPYARPLFDLLDEISTAEAAAGRGMMTALVVHKTGDMQPGPGFFELANRLGRDVSDITTCWVEEFKKVHAAWTSE